MERFIDREEELAFLDRRWREARRRAQLLVLYGRRRVGKTEILRRFLTRRRGVYYMADRRDPAAQLGDLARRFGTFFGDRFVASRGFRDWLELFAWLAERLTATRATEKPFVWILDEFPCLVEGEPALATLFQKGWDEFLCRCPILLVLCGSSIAMMESQTLAERAPLHGRRTGDLRIEPLPFEAARLFFPRLGFERALELHSLLGGMPAYLREFAGGRSMEHALREQVLTRGSFLFREVEFLVREELREPRHYLGILSAIAGGHRKFSEISNAVGMDRSSLPRYLQVLESLRLVEREVPVTEPHPHRSKKGHYRIADPFVTLWFRIVHPFRSELELGDVGPSLKAFRAGLPQWVAEGYERFAREHLGRARDLPVRLARVGRVWDRTGEVDIAGVDDTGRSVLFGKAKWSINPVGTDVLKALREKAARFTNASDGLPPTLVLFGRAGFTRHLLATANADPTLLLYHGDRRLR